MPRAIIDRRGGEQSRAGITGPECKLVSYKRRAKIGGRRAVAAVNQALPVTAMFRRRRPTLFSPKKQS